MTHILKELPGRLTYNRAFETVSYLYGNIGYLKFNKFHSADDAIRVADNAFLFLQNSDGLIIDMRDTVGGSPYLAQHMLSYFIETDTALWSVITRETKKFHTVKALNTPAHHRFREHYPVWILTSRQTASASELFAGVLQARGKATLVGEQTAGAGFYVGVRKITDRLVFRISLSKPVLAVTGANWEKIGLTPDITAERVDALDVAHQLANTK
ncbi:S41 family peptidase [Salinimonas chungwhensis]|uniref:S41 family peptidase n=1 Tax=Salinimonas chungwhensis TaxID=265425 RepID=UPI0012EA6C08|nr:S41 family peptidase [Salinimonas chungwhensis]